MYDVFRGINLSSSFLHGSGIERIVFAERRSVLTVSAPHFIGTMASRLTFTLILLALPVLQEGQGFSEILNLLKLIKKGEERDELQDILIKKPLAKGDPTIQECHPKKNTIDDNVGWFTVSIAPEIGRVVQILGEIPVSVCRLRH